ncbi:MAG: aldehyde dehydrogenase family protein, partial [Paracoccus sp. (in: a-proteobacteria)]
MNTHRTELKTQLKDPSLLETRAYVAGEWVDAKDGKTFPVSNPARGDVIAEVADLSRAEVARAIEAAHAAMKDWAARPAKERANVLRRWFDLMIANQDDLGRILTAEQGKPLAEARGEIAYGASFIEWFGEEAKRICGETIPGHMADKRLTVIRQPIGVACSITPWTFPTAMITRQCGPALAAG